MPQMLLDNALVRHRCLCFGAILIVDSIFWDGMHLSNRLRSDKYYLLSYSTTEDYLTGYSFLQ